MDIHNSFSFDLRVLTSDSEVESALSDSILGNIGICISWKLVNGAMVIDLASIDTGTRWTTLG